MREWRLQDIEQRVLNNAFTLWERYAEANRRFVEERAEQLKSFANLAALITGFAIVSYLQVWTLSFCHSDIGCALAQVHRSQMYFVA